MLKRNRVFVTIVLCCLASSCAKHTVVAVPEGDTGVRLAGMGVEFDPHFWSQNLTRNDGATESGWYDKQAAVKNGCAYFVGEFTGPRTADGDIEYSFKAGTELGNIAFGYMRAFNKHFA